MLPMSTSLCTQTASGAEGSQPKMAGNRKDRTYTNHKSIPYCGKPAGFCLDTEPRATRPSVEWNLSPQRAHCHWIESCRLWCLRWSLRLNWQWLGNYVSAFMVWVMNRRKFLTISNYIHLTHIELIYNGIGARRKRGCCGEDGEKHENKCEGTGDSEVHVCDIKTECQCVQLLGSFIRLSTESERSKPWKNYK